MLVSEWIWALGLLLAMLGWFFWSCDNSLHSFLKIFWSDSGDLVCIATDESFFVLRYLPEQISAAQESKEEKPEDGVEGAFEVIFIVQLFLFCFCENFVVTMMLVWCWMLSRFWVRSRRWLRQGHGWETASSTPALLTDSTTTLEEKSSP